MLRNSTEEFPDDVNSSAYLAMIYSFAGRHDEALAAMGHAGVQQNKAFAVWNGFVLAHAGRTAEARAVADRLDAAARTRYVPAYHRAMLRAELGDFDASVALLEQATREGEWFVKFLPVDAGFDRLRSDPRLTALLSRVPALPATASAPAPAGPSR